MRSNSSSGKPVRSESKPAASAKLGVALVHARADGHLVSQIGQYLERNCSVDLHYYPVQGDFLDVADRALSADAAVFFLSPHSIDRRFSRDEWEPLFLHTPDETLTCVAFVHVEECPFPKVLLRSNVFSAQPDLLACKRALKRWIFDLRPPARRASLPACGFAQAPVELWRELADQPATATIGSVEQARAFAAQAQDEFESVFWVDCRESTLAEIAGEMGVQMGLRLTGDARSNLESIRDLCARYRCLNVLEGPSDDASAEFRDSGRSSVLIVHPAPALAPVNPESASRQLRSLTTWMRFRDSPIPLFRDVRRTVQWLLDKDWDQAKTLADAAIVYLKHHDRLAEVFEFADSTLQAALLHRDLQTAHHAARERQWLIEGWGLKSGLDQLEVPTPSTPQQLGLFS